MLKKRISIDEKRKENFAIIFHRLFFWLEHKLSSLFFLSLYPSLFLSLFVYIFYIRKKERTRRTYEVETLRRRCSEFINSNSLHVTAKGKSLSLVRYVRQRALQRIPEKSQVCVRIALRTLLEDFIEGFAYSNKFYFASARYLRRETLAIVSIYLHVCINIRCYNQNKKDI